MATPGNSTRFDAIPLLDNVCHNPRAGPSWPSNTGTIAEGLPRQLKPLRVNSKRRYSLLPYNCSRRLAPSPDFTMRSAARTMATCMGDSALENVCGHEYISKYSFVAASFMATNPPFDENVFEKLPIRRSGQPTAFWNSKCPSPLGPRHPRS